jgi:hypothetical protein
MPLYVFGWICFVGVLITGALINISDTQVMGINAWIKPFKFFLSTLIFIWTMAWITGYLPQRGVVSIYSWLTIIVFAFELVYICFQAYNGTTSHFNISTKFHTNMWGLMGLSISIVTLFTAYIGWLFFTGSFPGLSSAYLWGIRLGIVIFVIFAFEGGLMGSQMSHTVGAPDGGPGLRILNWSVTHGDLRIAHFIGMHALQVLPLLGFYIIDNPKLIIATATCYFLLAIGVLIQALMGMPLLRLD